MPNGISIPHFALAMLGDNVTADQCNEFFRQFVKDVTITETELEMVREDLKREAPSRQRYLRAGKLYILARYLMKQQEARPVIVKLLKTEYRPILDEIIPRTLVLQDDSDGAESMTKWVFTREDTEPPK